MFNPTSSFKLKNIDKKQAEEQGRKPMDELAQAVSETQVSDAHDA